MDEARSRAGVWHTVLDVAGFLPVIGTGADLLNAALYLAEGDFFNAGLAATSAIPLAGDALALGRQALSHADEAAEALATVVGHADEAGELAGTVGQSAQVLINKQIGDAADAIAARYAGAAREAIEFAEDGIRRIDVLLETGLAIESKVGRTGLTARVQQELTRDLQLLMSDTSRVTDLFWEFTSSPITGKSGPTRALQEALDGVGIPWAIR